MRKISHMQGREAFLERFLSEMRFRQAIKYIKYGQVVADLGCGFHGNFLRRVEGKIKLGIGYDVSVSNSSLPKNITLKKIDLNKNIVIKKNYFDLVIALAVLEHIDNPEHFLKQIKLMLKKGGKVIITTPHKKGKNILEFISFKLGLVSRQEIMDHKNYFDETSLKNVFKKAGLIKIKIDTFELGLNLITSAKKN